VFVLTIFYNDLQILKMIEFARIFLIQ